jgi:hypothetical protein
MPRRPNETAMQSLSRLTTGRQATKNELLILILYRHFDIYSRPLCVLVCLSVYLYRSSTGEKVMSVFFNEGETS